MKCNSTFFLHHENVVCVCFMGLEKTLDRVPRTELEWAIRKKGIPEVFVISVIGRYEGAKTRVRVDSELSEQFEFKVLQHQHLCFHLLYIQL